MLAFKPVAGSNITGLKVIHCKIALDGSSAPSILEGRGVTVARSNTGIYTITLQDAPGAEFKGMQISLCKASGTLNLKVDDGGFNASTNVATFYTSLSSTGALADPPAAAATNYVSVTLLFGSPAE